MLERYTENARRVIYFARHQAGRVGSPWIGCAHLLLATLEQSGTMFFAAGLRGLAEFLTKDIKRTLPPAGFPIPADVDLRLSEDCINALARAAAEADRLRCHYINVAHLTLGLML